MKKILYCQILVIIVILNFRCAYYNTLFNAKKSYNNGIKILQSAPEKEINVQANKHFEQTIEKCWKLIELYSDKSKYADDALLYIVKSEFYMRKYAQSKSHINQFLLKYPKSELAIEANLWLGKLLIRENKEEEGKEYLNKVLNLSKDSGLRAEALYELGNLSFEHEDYNSAIDFFEKALEEKVDKQYAAFINYYLGESYFQQRNFKEAVKLYKKVEKFSPSLDIEYKTKFNLGKSYAELDKYDNALTTFRKMLTAPRFKSFVPLIKSEIANTYYKRGKIDEALELYKEVVREKTANSGTALASFELAKIYEKQIHNLDSAVYYYGKVKSLYSRFDSVKVADAKFTFLAELKEIKDKIKRDGILIFKLENDRYFRDSLYAVQYEDSILKELGSVTKVQVTPDTQQIDTTSTLFSKTIVQLDSIKTILEDSLILLENDTLKRSLEDSLQKVKSYLVFKAPKKQKEIEKRKLPEIQEDLKSNRYHLAEFYLINMQDFDSALVYYGKFLAQYEDTILTPKAIYSLHFIYTKESHHDDTKLDSLEKILLEIYPETPFSKEIQRRRGLLNIQSSQEGEDSYAKSLFLEAEKLYFSQNIDSALVVYRQVSEIDTSSIWAAKALFARAWIFEKDLEDLGAAVNEYQYILDTYEKSPYNKIASSKVKPIPDELAEKQTPDLKKDSTRTISTAVDSLDLLTEEGKETTIKTATGLVSLPLISKTKEYRQWRQNRSLKE